MGDLRTSRTPVRPLQWEKTAIGRQTPARDAMLEIVGVADSTAALAFDNWEHHCTALSRIVTADVLPQLTKDNANPGTDVTLAMLAGH